MKAIKVDEVTKGGKIAWGNIAILLTILIVSNISANFLATNIPKWVKKAKEKLSPAPIVAQTPTPPIETEGF